MRLHVNQLVAHFKLKYMSVCMQPFSSSGLPPKKVLVIDKMHQLTFSMVYNIYLPLEIFFPNRVHTNYIDAKKHASIPGLEPVSLECRSNALTTKPGLAL